MRSVLIVRALAATAGLLTLAGLTACASSSTSSQGGASSEATSGATSEATAGSSGGSSGGESSPSAATGPGGTDEAAELVDKAFVSTEVSGEHTLVTGSSISFTLSELEGQRGISVNAGCNTMFGAADLTGGVLSASQLAMTQMACEQPLMDQDQWLVAFLSSSPTWEFADGTLTLANGTDTIVFTESAGSDVSELESTGWRLTDLLSAGGSTTTAVDPTVTAWIRFLPGGEVGLNTGCNSGGGNVEATPTEMVWGPLIQTLIACEGPADETERAMTAVLQGTTPYTLVTSPSGETLTIMAEDGQTGLMFAADPEVGADIAVSSEVTATSTSGG